VKPGVAQVIGVDLCRRASASCSLHTCATVKSRPACGISFKRCAGELHAFVLEQPAHQLGARVVSASSTAAGRQQHARL